MPSLLSHRAPGIGVLRAVEPRTGDGLGGATLRLWGRRNVSHRRSTVGVATPIPTPIPRRKAEDGSWPWRSYALTLDGAVSAITAPVVLEVCMNAEVRERTTPERTFGPRPCLRKIKGGAGHCAGLGIEGCG